MMIFEEVHSVIDFVWELYLNSKDSSLHWRNCWCFFYAHFVITLNKFKK